MATKVLVYKNLHNGLWSIKDAKSNLVLGHAPLVVLSKVKPKVSEAGRQRVLREQRKNVHAYLCGFLEAAYGFQSYKGRKVYQRDDMINLNDYRWDKLTYNPYKGSHFSFVLKSTKEYTGSPFAVLSDTQGTFGVYANG